jgi:hypothetical protein
MKVRVMEALDVQLPLIPFNVLALGLSLGGVGTKPALVVEAFAQLHEVLG